MNVPELIDTGAKVSVFDISFVEKYDLPWERRSKPIRILNTDNSVARRGGRCRVREITLHAKDCRAGEIRLMSIVTETMDFKEKYSLVLGMDWMRQHVEKINILHLGIEFASKVDLFECMKEEEWDEVTKKNMWIGSISITQNKGITRAKLLDMVSGDSDTVRIRAITWTDKEGGDVQYRLPPQYRQFAEVFSQERQQALPEHGPHDMTITLQDGKEPPAGHLYPLSKDELDLLKEYLDEMLRTKKIRPSKGAAGAPIFFAKHPSGKLRIVVDYRGLNAVTVKDKYPLPLMTQLMESVSSAKYYTKLDLKNGFNLIRIAEGDEWKTAFRTRYGSYEYMVMPFGMTNAPSVFQRFMNGILSEYLDKGVIVYIDDILIYTETEEEHTRLVSWVLRRLAEFKLCVNIEKCIFHASEVEFVGFTIGSQGVRMSKDKVADIQDWERPLSVKEVQKFIGFANFYRRFIKGFSKICKPLTDLTKKGVLWDWSYQCKEAFKHLKKGLTEELILEQFWPDRPKMF